MSCVATLRPYESFAFLLAFCALVRHELSVDDLYCTWCAVLAVAVPSCIRQIVGVFIGIISDFWRAPFRERIDYGRIRAD